MELKDGLSSTIRLMKLEIKSIPYNQQQKMLKFLKRLWIPTINLLKWEIVIYLISKNTKVERWENYGALSVKCKPMKSKFKVKIRILTLTNSGTFLRLLLKREKSSSFNEFTWYILYPSYILHHSFKPIKHNIAYFFYPDDLVYFVWYE